MYRPGSSLSKAKQSKGGNLVGGIPARTEIKLPQLEDYLKERDWVGAIVFLENERSFSSQNMVNSLWLAYCCFHNGDYRKAINIYDQIMKIKDYDKKVHLYKACCLYALLNYNEAKKEAQKGFECPLQNRLMFHIAHKQNDEKNLMTYHHKLSESTADQLCLAAIHYLRSHFEEATDIYKKLLLENREFLAINVYVALCYYKMDYYDVSLEILQSFLSKQPSSVIGVNLRATNQFQLYSGKAAQDVLKTLQQVYEGGDVFTDNDLLRHNLVVFSNGQNALNVLSPLVEVFPEARLNLIVYHLRNENYLEAFNCVKDLEPTVPREYIIKAVVYSIYGQSTESREQVKIAQNLFQLVGSSASECDTIPGRQCMASCFFLLKQFDDVLVYLKSVKQFYEKDDSFNWNYGIALAATGEFKEAEVALSQVMNEKFRSDECFLRWLVRVQILNGQPRLAWELYANMDTSIESFSLLQVIANDCYNMGHFYYAAKAFDILERLDSEKEYEDALRGAVVGVFQMVIAKKETVEHLVESLNMLKYLGNNPQVEYIFKVVNKWAKDSGIKI